MTEIEHFPHPPAFNPYTVQIREKLFMYPQCFSEIGPLKNRREYTWIKTPVGCSGENISETIKTIFLSFLL